MNLNFPVGPDVNVGQPNGLDCARSAASVNNNLEFLDYMLPNSTSNQVAKFNQGYGMEINAINTNGTVDWTQLQIGDLIYVDAAVPATGVIGHVANLCRQ
ncbi:hypothetical protein [Paenibacillus koleovorans]|uniref:hypothetical protein n=1 Tax=Paenibacillus koleovorans TaxID=121608 RepID=UPI000FD8A033|nr:hypothetical protein [Paenibacillus koleovorans]